MTIERKDIPKGYAHCFAGVTGCPKAETCLRAIAAKLIAESEDEQPQTVNTVNALFVERLTDRAACPLYRSNQPARYARGMTYIFDEFTFKQSVSARRNIMACFSCETYYYHSRKGRRLINLDEQRKIRNVFRAIAPALTPKFDSYEDVIVWEAP